MVNRLPWFRVCRSNRIPAVALSPGQRLGPYEISALIGAGGMGEVYRATDTNLKRAVAIKVLPAAVSNDPDRLARFQREAEVLAALNNPHIASIYGLERGTGMTALVMELVEGPTLADRIAQGRIPIDEALPLARQIVAALESAHERGIIHRDLKPANIKLRPDGTVKVLDFGLAKALAPDAASSTAGISMSPTLTTPGTQLGVILGTAAYMSPEQARGQAVDRASDIWAFGCVLYEMLVGKPVVAGDTITDILGGIVRVDPDWTALPDDVPASIRSLLRHCLHKDRRRRLKDVSDASLEIEDVIAGVAQPAVAPAPGAHATTRRGRERMAWLAAGGLLVIAAVSMPFAIVHVRENVPEDRTIRFDVPMPEKAIAAGAPPMISPDGTRLAFVASQGSRIQIWIRPIGSTVSQPLAGTDGADYPFWSPDSRFIAFFAGGKLRKIDASGGPPQTLSEAPAPRGGTWSRDDVIVFVPSATGPLHRVAAAGGTSTPVTQLDVQKGEINHRSPTFLPDGRRFLFMVQGPENIQGIHVGSLDTPGSRLVLASTSNGAYAHPGYLLFLRERTLMAQPLDLETIALTGEAVPVAEGVGFYNATSSTFSVSDNGVIAHSDGIVSVGSDRQLAWFDRTGKLVERVGSSIPIADVALSPDQKRAAVQWSANDIRVVDLLRGGVPPRLTFNASVEDFPVWSPKGDRLLYTSTAGGGQNMYSKISSGAGSEEAVLKSPAVKRPTDWSPDFILYEEDDQKTQTDLWVLPLSGDRKPKLYLQTPFSEQHARFSPDGRWVAYVSNDTGPPEVNVQSFPVGGGKWQVSTNGGVTPRWRRDGKELFYLALDRKIMSVAIRTVGGTFDHGTATPLFESLVDAVNTIATNRYDVSPNGQRFLVNASPENASSRPITVVVNWLAAVKGAR